MRAIKWSVIAAYNLQIGRRKLPKDGHVIVKLHSFSKRRFDLESPLKLDDPIHPHKQEKSLLFHLRKPNLKISQVGMQRFSRRCRRKANGVSQTLTRTDDVVGKIR